VLLAYSFLRYMVRFFSILGSTGAGQDPEHPVAGSEESSAEG